MKRINVLAIVKATVTVSILALGCQATRAGQRGGGDSLSLIEEARDCGMVVTVGRQAGGYGSDEGRPLQLPALINLVAQSVACGDNGAEAGTQWLAIGMGVERPQVFVVSREQAPSVAQVRLTQDGTVELIGPSGQGLAIGKAIEPDVSMPVALQPGTKVEIRFQGRSVGAKEAKSIGVENLEIWLIPAGV